MMALLASGATATIDSVHILWCSMVSTICGPSMWRMNCGSRQREHRAQRPTRKQDHKRQQYVAELALHDRRIAVAQKIEDSAEAFAPARINDMVGASQ